MSCVNEISNEVKDNEVIMNSNNSACISMSHATEVVNNNNNNNNNNDNIQYAVPYNNEIQIIDQSLIIRINKLTILLCVLNLPYIFMNFGFYILRISFMMICQYYGIYKKKNMWY